MYCLIYYESKLCTLYAFIIIDLISCVRCMETEKHYCNYAFIIIDLKSCVICMETEKHYCKYRSIMYCLIYYESKLCTLSMHL